ncbi:carbonic anhydrase [Paenibacillus tianjinensis]|uniref:carbonic anhydrase n=1 Tax=Paenibacillus tianjinensis TaxID=2810347 RepID=A0ABX7LDU1_9BACL|nr:carbonic anhydrase family protein [Paenibacillus tianjinensis]QSF46299.1 carbonic anhydrase family protein [Paenibacillus tianjinensis]
MRINKWIPRILFPAMVISVMAGCGNNAPNHEAEGINEPSPTAGAHQAHWSYEGDTSPEHWAELDQLFTTCSTGTAQSPVNILHEQVKDDKSLSLIKVEYSPSPVAIINNGHTIQVNLKNQDNRLEIEGKTYTLQQFHFHLPSEHEVDGKHAEMELHLVHKSEDGSLAVLSVLIHKGSENTGLNQLWSVLPPEESEQETPVAGDFNLDGLLPTDLHSFRYQGSLTTPPCTEGVQWIILENPVQWSGEQIGKFAAIFPHDNRPVQTLGNREIDSDE